MPWRPIHLLTLLAFLACRRADDRPLAGAPTTSASTIDPYHFPPLDTLPQPLYEGWKQYQLACARCHGEDARGTSFGPDLVESLRTDGRVHGAADFAVILAAGRPDRGMPSAVTLGLDPRHFGAIYDYLKGRSDNRIFGGRPALRVEP